MKPFVRIATMVTGLVLLLNVAPCWSQPVCAAPACNPTTSDGNNNTAGGSGALSNLVMEAVSNTAFGQDALFNNTTGSGNTATGNEALFSNTTGVNNTASGDGALVFNNGNNNTAVGSVALFSTSTGSENTASGSSALFSNDTGSQNTAVGFLALGGNISGDRNTAIGTNALGQSTGNKNIAVGFNAGSSLTSGNNNIYIGNQGGAGSEFQTIRIGTAPSQTFIAGIANATVSNDATVIIDTTTGQLGIPLSSARYKQDITPMGSRSEKVLDLRPVTFAYKDDARAVTHYGLIAEEVATVYPDLVTRTASGEVQTVKYHELIPMLLNELQREHQARQQERAEMATLRQELAELRALVGSRQEK